MRRHVASIARSSALRRRVSAPQCPWGALAMSRWPRAQRPSACHVGLGPGHVDEDQAGGVEPAWMRLPAHPQEKYGRWMTVYQRFRRWSEAGIREAVASAMTQAMADNRHHSIDSTTVCGYSMTLQ